MGLLRLDDDGDFSLVKRVGSHIPLCAILSHISGADDEEVFFKILRTLLGQCK